MKILFMTDSHRHFSFLLEMVEKEKPDAFFAMGDYSSDFEELSYVYPDIPCTIVCGNCDFWDRKNPEEILLELEGKRIFLSHGHKYGVKSSLASLLEKGKSLSADIILFGHTHKEYLLEGEIAVANPGAAQDKKYGILEVTQDSVKIQLKKL